MRYSTKVYGDTTFEIRRPGPIPSWKIWKFHDGTQNIWPNKAISFWNLLHGTVPLFHQMPGWIAICLMALCSIQKIDSGLFEVLKRLKNQKSNVVIQAWNKPIMRDLRVAWNALHYYEIGEVWKWETGFKMDVKRIVNTAAASSAIKESSYSMQTVASQQL